jgi:S-adenosylhomocysteine hydrolase
LNCGSRYQIQRQLPLNQLTTDFCCVLLKVGHFDFEIFLKKVDIEKKERKKNVPHSMNYFDQIKINKKIIDSFFFLHQ